MRKKILSLTRQFGEFFRESPCASERSEKTRTSQHKNCRSDVFTSERFQDKESPGCSAQGFVTHQSHRLMQISNERLRARNGTVANCKFRNECKQYVLSDLLKKAQLSQSHVDSLLFQSFSGVFMGLPACPCSEDLPR